MLTLSETLKYYKRKEIQEAILENAENREIAIKFGDNGFGKRPDVLKYPGDVLELVKQGATSFHASEELWKNPLLLDPMMKKKEIDDLRSGWDLIIDIDCEVWEYSKLAAYLIVEALKHHNIKSYSVKFSGNKGFHIGVLFEAFPEKVAGKKTKYLFPEAPRIIADYLQKMIKNPLRQEMLKLGGFETIKKKPKKDSGDKAEKEEFDPFSIISIDTILISSRHLYRMPYSLNEKSGLASIPIDPEKIREFKKEQAVPEKVFISKFKFLDKTKVAKGEAKQLIVQAFDYEEKKEELQIENQKEFEQIEKAIPEKFFPPCIKTMLKGLEDGRKRSLFILVNFLTSVGWDYDEIRKLLKEWNEKNETPLTETIIQGQIRYHQQQKKKILPPNCSNTMYYKDLRVCAPDNLCSKIKNPVNYSIRKTKYLKNQ